MNLLVTRALGTKAPFRIGPRARAPCLGTKIDVVQTHQFPELKMFVNNLEKALTIHEKSVTNLGLMPLQLAKTCSG